MAYRFTRQHPRYALEAEVAIDAPEERLQGTTRNLSRGGLCADLDAPIQPGTYVSLRISLVFDTKAHSEPLALDAKVVWCTPLGGRYQIGVKFGLLDSKQVSYLELFLRFLEEARARGAV